MLSRRNFTILGATVFLACTASVARPQETAGGPSADLAAIKQVFADFYGAFSRQDAQAITNTFAPDAEFTNMFGIHVHGREAIQRRFTALFKGNLKGTDRTDTVREVHFYAPDVAFVDADTVITGTKQADGSIGPVRKGLMIVVMTKQEGKWYISNFHEAEYPARAVPVIPASK
jgi:uncharacterized protein (TIGR02246 family)